MFKTGPIDPRIFSRLDTNMWRVAATYLPAADIAKLATCCAPATAV
jgi:hypothetical protein